MSFGDWLILGLLALALVLALRYTATHKNKCSGGCAGCPHQCQQKEEDEP